MRTVQEPLGPRILASSSSRWEVSPVPQEPVPLPWSFSLLAWNAERAPANPFLTAAFASARCPRPTETPLNACTFAPSLKGAGRGQKLYLKFFQLSPAL